MILVLTYEMVIRKISAITYLIYCVLNNYVVCMCVCAYLHLQSTTVHNIHSYIQSQSYYGNNNQYLHNTADRSSGFDEQEEVRYVIICAFFPFVKLFIVVHTSDVNPRTIIIIILFRGCPFKANNKNNATTIKIKNKIIITQSVKEQFL